MAILQRRLNWMTKALLAGLFVFLLMSIFASDPSPDEVSYPAERTCRNDWRKCASDEEMLKNWNVELKGGSPTDSGAVTRSAGPKQ